MSKKIGFQKSVILSVVVAQFSTGAAFAAGRNSCGRDHAIRVGQYRKEIENFLNRNAIILPREQNFDLSGSVSGELKQQPGRSAAGAGAVLGYLFGGVPGAIGGALAGDALASTQGRLKGKVNGEIHGKGYQLNPDAQTFAVLTMDSDLVNSLKEMSNAFTSSHTLDSVQCAKGYLGTLMQIKDKYPVSTPTGTREFMQSVLSYNQELQKLRDVRFSNPTTCTGLDGIIRDASDFLENKKIISVDLTRNSPSFVERDVTIFNFEGRINFRAPHQGGWFKAEDLENTILGSELAPIQWSFVEKPDTYDRPYFNFRPKANWKLSLVRLGKISVDELKQEVAKSEFTRQPGRWGSDYMEDAKERYETFKKDFARAGNSTEFRLDNKYGKFKGLYGTNSEGKPDFGNLCSDPRGAYSFFERNTGAKEFYLSFPQSSGASQVSAGEFTKSEGPTGGSAYRAD